MIILSAFILTLVGCANWLGIAIFQYDFVAGLFGSQASIFSRIIYGIIGIAAILMVVAAIKGKGTIKINGKKETDKELLGIGKKNKQQKPKKQMAMAESGKDTATKKNTQKHNCNCGDNCKCNNCKCNKE